MAKVMEMVALTLMPMSCAAALSSEQARMALPILVFPVNQVSPSMMTTQAATVTMAAMVIFSSPPKNSMGLAEKKEGNILMLEVHSSWAPFWRK